jgi:hypothetical protein
MATSFQLLTSDMSTVANFKSWGQAISVAMGTTFGWSQSSDTGQVNWSTISSVPTGNNYVYEMWQPNDGGTNFLLKIEYGAYGNNGFANVRVSLGTTTNGAGVFTGNYIGTFQSSITNNGYPSSLPLPCRFSGAPGRFAIIMWDTSNLGFLLAVERSIDSSGNYTNSYVTLIQTQWTNNGATTPVGQQSLIFGVGGAPAYSIQNNSGGGLAIRTLVPSQVTSYIPIWWNQVGFDLVSPYVGYLDNQMTMVGLTNNYANGMQATATVYGNTHTYWVTSNSFSFLRAGPCGINSNQSTNQAVVMRYD